VCVCVCVCFVTAEGSAERLTENTAGRGPGIADQLNVEEVTAALRNTIIIIIIDADHRRRHLTKRLASL